MSKKKSVVKRLKKDSKVKIDHNKTILYVALFVVIVFIIFFVTQFNKSDEVYETDSVAKDLSSPNVLPANNQPLPLSPIYPETGVDDGELPSAKPDQLKTRFAQDAQPLPPPTYPE